MSNLFAGESKKTMVKREKCKIFLEYKFINSLDFIKRKEDEGLQSKLVLILWILQGVIESLQETEALPYKYLNLCLFAFMWSVLFYFVRQWAT